MIKRFFSSASSSLTTTAKTIKRVILNKPGPSKNLKYENNIIINNNPLKEREVEVKVAAQQKQSNVSS